MKNLFLSLVVLISTGLYALGGTAVPDHSEWNSLLQHHVTSSGVVDYEGFKKDAKFIQYLLVLEGSHPDDSWTRNQKMAYWINAYNAFTIKLIVDNLPLKSIKDIGEPWKKAFIKIEGKNYTLDQIENSILRPQFNDPRIHFAINCASMSCPPLSTRAYMPSSLDSQLEKVTRAFINDDRFNVVAGSIATISPVFDWFAADFSEQGGVREFINTYANSPITRETTIKYAEYDWSLNNK